MAGLSWHLSVMTVQYVGALLLGIVLALIGIWLVRLGPAGRAPTPDRFFRELGVIGAVFASIATLAGLMAALFAPGMLAGVRDEPGAELPVGGLVFGLLLCTSAAVAMYGLRYLAMRHKSFRRRLRGKARQHPRVW